MDYNNSFNEISQKAKIKIIGVGGAGGNVVNDMIERGIHGVEFVAINTDAQDLDKSRAETKISLGHLGAGAIPEIGRQAAEAKEKEIKKVLEGQDMIFITAGMGGGTGTGASPIVAKIAKEEGILTVAVVTTPFLFEGMRKQANAKQGLDELKKNVDALIVVPNHKLFEIALSENTELDFESFTQKRANEVLYYGIKGIAELITHSGFMNIDFADVKNILSKSGMAMFGFSESEAHNLDIDKLVNEAITNPLLEREIKGATKLLYNITAGKNTPFTKTFEIAQAVSKRASGSEVGGVENVIFGFITEPERENVLLTVIATAFEDEKKEKEIVSEDEKAMAKGLFDTEETEEVELMVPRFEEGE